MKKNKEVPIFKSEEEELLFWETHDSTEYMDWDKSEQVIFSHLKPTTKTISLRLPEYLLENLRVIANKRDVPYQSLLKLFLKEKIDKETQKIRQSNPRSA